MERVQKMTIENPDLREIDDTVTLSIERRALAVEAIGEIEELCLLIQNSMRENGMLGYAGIVSRIKKLSRITQGIIGDRQESTADLQTQLTA